MEPRDITAARNRMGPEERELMKDLLAADDRRAAVLLAEIFGYFPDPGVRLATEEEVSRLDDLAADVEPEDREVPRGNVEDKGRTLLTEGRLTVTRVDDWIMAKCRGDSGEVYDLGYDPRGAGQWRCTCEARGKCSHLVALQLVTVAPERSA